MWDKLEEVLNDTGSWRKLHRSPIFIENPYYQRNLKKFRLECV